MNRITVEVFLPAAGRSFDVCIPTEVRFSQVTELVAKTLTELSGGLYRADVDAALCDLTTGEFLNINMMVWELGLCNGSQLMLI